MVHCNICQSSSFKDFNGRSAIQCAVCGSLERHRLVKETLASNGCLDKASIFGIRRALHLAPEKMTYDYLSPVYGSGYYSVDLFPEKYPHCSPMKLRLPEGFNVFPEGYFSLVLHNHVLEHIPGSFKQHIDQFVRILRPGGVMVFTVPSIRSDTNTVEGGENLATDADRIRAHGQNDHYKTFGKDLIIHLRESGGDFWVSDVEFCLRQSINALKDNVYCFRKH